MPDPSDHPDQVVRHDVGAWISGPCLPNPHGMSAEDATALFELRRIWENRYKIDYNSADGVWTASRLLGGVSVITADTAKQLCGLISEDYATWARGLRRHQS